MVLDRAMTVFVEISAVLAEMVFQKQGVDALDDHVQAHVLVVDVESRVCRAGYGYAKRLHELKRDALVEHRRLLSVVAQNNRRQSQESLIGAVAIEVDA